MRDEELLESLFEQHDISCVIHFAGLKAVNESVSKPHQYCQDNLSTTLSLCRIMAKRNVKKIIFFSSATVYSGNKDMPLSGSSATGNCTNPYGWTAKLDIEDMCRGTWNWQKDTPNGYDG